MKEGKGDIVDWGNNSFITHSIKINEIDPRIFCDCSEKLILFPGRRRLTEASDLCTAHGGWIVVPKSSNENAKVMNMYKDNIEDCKQEGLDAIGWLGVSYYDEKYYISQSNGIVRTSNFTNFKR